MFHLGKMADSGPSIRSRPPARHAFIRMPHYREIEAPCGRSSRTPAPAAGTYSGGAIVSTGGPDSSFNDPPFHSGRLVRAQVSCTLGRVIPPPGSTHAV